MAGYATQARLQGVTPRLALAGAHPSRHESRVGTSAASPGEPPLTADRVELVGRPIDARIGDWLASIGESWSQLTFFLFDPQGWR